jgi:hypothetical protein
MFEAWSQISFVARFAEDHKKGVGCSASQLPIVDSAGI